MSPAEPSGRGVRASGLTCVTALLVATVFPACGGKTQGRFGLGFADAPDAGVDARRSRVAPDGSSAAGGVEREDTGLSRQDSGKEADPADLLLCAHLAADYRYDSIEACLTSTLACGPGVAVFADDCGCGCTAAWFDDSRARPPVRDAPEPELEPEPEVGPCGVTGEFILFETSVARMVIGDSDLYLATSTDAWRVDKRLGRATRSSASPSALEPAPASVVSHGETDAVFRVDNARYWNEGGLLVRSIDAAESPEVLFPVPGADDEGLAFVVSGAHFYATSSEGTLWHGRVSPQPIAPTPVETRGEYDDDDYSGLLGVDSSAVYWQAGIASVLRTSDKDPLAVFRTCRDAVETDR